MTGVSGKLGSNPELVKSLQSPPSDETIRNLIEKNGIVVFTCTYYTSVDDLRFQQCMKTLEVPAGELYPLVIVDGSPNDKVHEALCKSGNIVHRQKSIGGKGAALREAADIASKLPGVRDSTLLCWQEPEKTHMALLWGDIRQSLQGSVNDDVIVPYRRPYFFQESYPIEQYHSETYGNFYLDAVMNDALKRNKEAKPPRLSEYSISVLLSEQKLPCIDWHFGPFAFQAKHIDLWTKYTAGDSYDAQVVPIVHAMRKGLTVSSVVVNFELDADMKTQEEDNLDFIEKRLNQLNDLDPKVKKAWTDDFYC